MTVLPDVSDAELLGAVLERLLSCPSAELPGPVALERTRALLVACERLRAVALDAVRDMDVRELYLSDGAGSASGWVRRERTGSRVAPVTLARRLSVRPCVRAALGGGELDVLAAEKLCVALERLPELVDEPTLLAVLHDGIPGLLQELSGGADPDPTRTAAVLDGCEVAYGAPPADRLEPAVVLLATRIPPRVLAWALNYLVDALLPEQHLERWEEEQARTHLELRELLDGYLEVRGLLDPETGASLRCELVRRTAALTGLTDPRIGTTSGQRRVYALRQLLRDAAALRGAGQPDPGPSPDEELPAGWDGDGWADWEATHAVDGSAEPEDDDPDVEQDGTETFLTALTAVPEEQPDGLGAVGAADAEGVQLTLVVRPLRDPVPEDPDGSVLLDPTVRPPLLATVDAVLGAPGALPGRYGPRLATSLPTEALRRLGCGGALAAVLLDAAGRPIGASGTHRNATERERRALLAQWGSQCATDGCPNPGVIPHHVEPWWLSRRTRLCELVPYCDSCHHDTHEGQKTIKLRNGRWISPTGWIDPLDQTRLAS